jgi:hypothetical protein
MSRMVVYAWTLAAVVALAALALAETGTPATPAQPRPRLGMNIDGPADYNTELPLVDVFRFSRVWISQQKGQPWGKGPSLVVDERGWVKKLDADCWAETLLCTIDGGHYPGGEYTALYDGEGKLDCWGAGSVVSREPGRTTIKVDPAKGCIFLKVVETNPENHLRNIRVPLPGFEKSYRDCPFHPVFLKRWQGVACLRFMDLMRTNGSKIEQWSDRPRMDDATFCGKGMAPEMMIDLANRLDADPWFCMPHLADDDYVRNFAAMVKSRLKPNLKIYVEYSNEVWNGMFEQHRYAERRAKEMSLGAAERPWEGACMFYAQRSVEMFKIWQEVFGGTDRLVRVLAWQAGSGRYWTDGMLLSKPGIAGNVDALAIAPYLTFCVPEQSNNPKALTAATVSKWAVDQALDHMETKALPESIEWIRQQKKVADQYGLKLVAYEGGQHMVGVMGGENNEAMTKLFHAANRHPRMGEIYRKYFDAWTAAGGDLFCYFASTGVWSKWGSWGLLEWYDDDPAKSPKFQATMGWAKQCGQKVSLP